MDDLLRKEVVELIFERIAAYRLCEITVEAFACIECAVLFIGVCGEDNDGCFTASAACLLLDPSSALDTVHLGHEMVHEDDVVLDVKSLSECFSAARSRVDTDLRIS